MHTLQQEYHNDTHLVLVLVVGLAGGKELGVQYVHFQAEEVVRLGDVPDQHAL